jgi:hypothetical protein
MKSFVIVAVFLALLLLPFAGIGCGGIPDCHTDAADRIYGVICQEQ